MSYRNVATLLAACMTVGSGVAMAQSFTVHERPPLAKQIDSLPRLSASAADAMTVNRINRQLSAIDTKTMMAARECASERNEPHEEADGWQRKVSVTSSEGSLLSIVVVTESFCGGPHPNSDMEAFVFNVATGAPLNWMRFLPRSATAELSTAVDGTKQGVVKWPALQVLAVAQAKAVKSKGCIEVLQSPEEEPTYILWLDAKRRAVVALQNDLSFAVEACALPIVLDAAKAKRIGVSDEVFQLAFGAR